MSFSKILTGIRETSFTQGFIEIKNLDEPVRVLVHPDLSIGVDRFLPAFPVGAFTVLRLQKFPHFFGGWIL